MFKLFGFASLCAAIPTCKQCLPPDAAFHRPPEFLWKSEDNACDAKSNPLLGPSNYATLPHGIQCCATHFGPDKVAGCLSSSCADTFGGAEHTCFNYGSAANPALSDFDQGATGPDRCPFSKEDKAVCDVSEYIRINGVNCREASENCLGKVKCNTLGVSLWGSSNGTAAGGGPCKFASPGFVSGQDCIYDGRSEKWRVCSSSVLQSVSRALLSDTPQSPPLTPDARPPTTRRPTDGSPSLARGPCSLTCDSLANCLHITCNSPGNYTINAACKADGGLSWACCRSAGCSFNCSGGKCEEFTQLNVQVTGEASSVVVMIHDGSLIGNFTGSRSQACGGIDGVCGGGNTCTLGISLPACATNSPTSNSPTSSPTRSPTAPTSGDGGGFP